MARIRTFIAVDLAAGVKDRVIGLQEELGPDRGRGEMDPPAKPAPDAAFLGDVGELDVVKICRVVQARSRKHAPFTVDAAGLGAFPNGRRPKILLGRASPRRARAAALHADLEEGLLDLGCYRREDREYTPHLTLGRLSHEDRAADWAPVLAKYEEWPGGPSAVDEVLVMSSEMPATARNTPSWAGLRSAANPTSLWRSGRRPDRQTTPLSWLGCTNRRPPSRRPRPHSGGICISLRRPSRGSPISFLAGSYHSSRECGLLEFGSKTTYFGRPS